MKTPVKKVQFCFPVRLGHANEDVVDLAGKVHAARWTVTADDELDRLEIYDRKTGTTTIVPYTNVASMIADDTPVTKSPPVKQRGTNAS